MVFGLAGLLWSQWDEFSRTTQAAMLFEKPDNPDRPSKETNPIYASVTWDLVEGTGGTAVVASIEVPGTGLRLRVSIRKDDPTLRFGDVIDVEVVSPPRFATKVLSAVGALAAKPGPLRTGEDLKGAVAKLAEGRFRFTLARDEGAAAANARLLSERDFFDLPLTYASGQNAVLTFEKGRSGIDVFHRAFEAWHKTGSASP
jgi:hypothetical protein